MPLPPRRKLVLPHHPRVPHEVTNRQCTIRIDEIFPIPTVSTRVVAASNWHALISGANADAGADAGTHTHTNISAKKK
ncbi:hypothetical protein N7461_004138 [Penicillium sp. DV-2018c]|nr:hypothetical protein N7461_004138 [Penicillium sp. DV-2018c]